MELHIWFQDLQVFRFFHDKTNWISGLMRTQRVAEDDLIIYLVNFIRDLKDQRLLRSKTTWETWSMQSISGDNEKPRVTFFPVTRLFLSKIALAIMKKICVICVMKLYQSIKKTLQLTSTIITWPVCFENIEFNAYPKLYVTVEHFERKVNACREKNKCV